MKEMILSFLSFAAIIGGVAILGEVVLQSTNRYNPFFLQDHLISGFIAVVLISAGLTYFRFCSRRN